MALALAICSVANLAKAQERPPGPFVPTVPEDSAEGPYENEHVFGGLQIHKPGLKVRLAQNLSELIKKDVAVYGREFLNFDYKIPPRGVKYIRSFPFYLNLHYQDLAHDPISIDMEKFAFNFTRMVKDDEAVVYLSIPMIEEWNTTFSYNYKFLGMVNREGTATIGIRNLNALATLKLKATQHGHLHPELHDLELDFGESQLYEGSKWSQFWHRQLFGFGKYILQSAYNSFGVKYINQRLFALSREYLNEQIFHFPLSIPQLDKSGDFNLNWRMTADPVVHSHLLDLAFFMDIGPDSSHCTEPQDTHDYYFQDFGAQYIQFILSDRPINCMLAAMERHNWFHHTISSEFMASHFGSQRMKVNAGLFVMLYPSIAARYGAEQELEVQLNMKKPRVKFGMDDSDITLYTDIEIGLKLKGSMNYLIYDEIQFKMNGDFSIDQETIIGNVKNLKFLRGGYDQSRDMPVFHDDDIEINM